LNKREDTLRELLADEDFVSQHPHHPMSYSWFQWAEANGVLPFEGGLSDQPQWWLDDVTFFRLYRELHVTIPKDRRSAHERINDLRRR
jgi:hypothetical protein